MLTKNMLKSCILSIVVPSAIIEGLSIKNAIKLGAAADNITVRIIADDREESNYFLPEKYWLKL